MTKMSVAKSKLQIARTSLSIGWDLVKQSNGLEEETLNLADEKICEADWMVRTALELLNAITPEPPSEWHP